MVPKCINDGLLFRRSLQAWFAALRGPPDWLVERAHFFGSDGHEMRLLSYLCQ